MLLTLMAARRNRFVLYSDTPESLTKDVISLGSELSEVRLEVELHFPEVLVSVHPLEGVARGRRSGAVKEAGLVIARKLAANLVSRFGFSLPETLVGSLARRRHTLAVAESCTGGMVSNLVTNVPGASRVMRLATVTYANDVKSSLLGVSARALERHGAVSRSTARQMLRGVREAGSTDCALVTTGIAGPTGAADGKPVGLIYIGACAGERQSVLKRNLRARSRLQFKKLASFGVMKLLLDLLRSGGRT